MTDGDTASEQEKRLERLEIAVLQHPQWVTFDKDNRFKWWAVLEDAEIWVKHFGGWVAAIPNRANEPIDGVVELKVVLD